MGRYENCFDPDLAWMTDKMVDVNDVEPVEPPIPLFENALELYWPSPSSSFRSLFQLDTVDTEYGHPVNASWNTEATTASANDLTDIGELSTVFGCERCITGGTFDQDHAFRARSQSISAPSVHLAAMADYTDDQKQFSLPSTSSISQMNLPCFENDPNSSLSTLWGSSLSVLDKTQAFVNVPSEIVFSQPSSTSTLAFLDYATNLSDPRSNAESLRVESAISRGQLEAVIVSNCAHGDSDIRTAVPACSSQPPENSLQETAYLDDLQWLLGTTARGVLETEASISGLDGLNSADGLIRPLDVGQQTQTNAPDIWSFYSRTPTCALLRGEDATTPRAFLDEFLPALIDGGTPLVDYSLHLYSANPTAACIRTVDNQQRQLHHYTHGLFYSHSVDSPQRPGHRASPISNAQIYKRELLVPSTVISHKRRRRLTLTESEYLMTQFHENERPTAQERDMFARRLNLDRKTVQVWFQNRRAKLKRDLPVLFVDNSGREN